MLTQHDWVNQPYRIETVETLPVERISINDKERQNQGQATAAGQYKSQRLLVFVETIADHLKNQLQDKRWQVLDFSDNDVPSCRSGFSLTQIS